MGFDEEVWALHPYTMVRCRTSINLKLIVKIKMSVYVDEINNIESEMKRLRQQLKNLKELKKTPSKALYRYMKARNLTVYKSIKI